MRRPAGRHRPYVLFSMRSSARSISSTICWADAESRRSRSRSTLMVSPSPDSSSNCVSPPSRSAASCSASAGELVGLLHVAGPLLEQARLQALERLGREPGLLRLHLEPGQRADDGRRLASGLLRRFRLGHRLLGRRGLLGRRRLLGGRRLLGRGRRRRLLHRAGLLGGGRDRRLLRRRGLLRHRGALRREPSRPPSRARPCFATGAFLAGTAAVLGLVVFFGAAALAMTSPGSERRIVVAGRAVATHWLPGLFPTRTEGARRWRWRRRSAARFGAGTVTGPPVRSRSAVRTRRRLARPRRARGAGARAVGRRRRVRREPAPAATARRSGSSTRARPPPTAARASTTCGPASSRTSTPASTPCGARTWPARAAGTATACPVEVEVEKELGVLGQARDRGLRHRARSTASAARRCSATSRTGQSLTEPHRHVARHRRRVLDARQRVHRERVVAVPPDVGRRQHLRGLQGRALLRALRHRAVEPRARPARRVPRRHRAVGLRALPGRRPRLRPARVDDHAVDAAVERRRRGRPRHRVRPRARARRRARPRDGARRASPTVLGDDAEIVGPVAASDLVGLHYERPFDFLALAGVRRRGGSSPTTS